jgi:hypothetical protein
VLSIVGLRDQAGIVIVPTLLCPAAAVRTDSAVGPIAMFFRVGEQPQWQSGAHYPVGHLEGSLQSRYDFRQALLEGALVRFPGVGVGGGPCGGI